MDVTFSSGSPFTFMLVFTSMGQPVARWKRVRTSCRRGFSAGVTVCTRLAPSTWTMAGKPAAARHGTAYCMQGDAATGR